ncbi:hypothetical protein DB30_00629 [Enhygromyxa salina]|uniref:Uncharacterized protein n=1 Tax=Enhygromyxa salina TaxID=215803 RepID=A0A0C1ZLD0_9BACT|nr:hypothetical protein DB30_00629 [Enhygromyxa salina]
MLAPSRSTLSATAGLLAVGPNSKLRLTGVPCFQCERGAE